MSNPRSVPWIRHMLSMRQSPAWKYLPDNARRVLDRIEVEFMQHGGKKRDLIVTYTDFVRAGIRRKSIPAAIRQCEELGFVKVRQRGGQSIGARRWPSKYRLTYLNGNAKSSPAPTHDWFRIKSDAEAIAALNRVKAGGENAPTGAIFLLKKPGAKTPLLSRSLSRRKG